VAGTFSHATHKHGVGLGREFENFSKKRSFLSFRPAEKVFFYFFLFYHSWSPLEKLLEKSTSGPPEKLPPTPMHIIGM